MAAFRRQRLDYDLAGRRAGPVGGGAGDRRAGRGRRWAAAAERRFRRRGNDARACLAAADPAARPARRHRAAGPDSRPRRPAGRAAARPRAGRRRGHGRADRGPGAGRGRAHRRGHAAAIAVVRRRGPAVPLDVGLLRQLARAELAEAEGRPGTALAELRAGLAMVHARRGRLGSIDLQTGTAALGADLAAAGLRLALERGSAPLVFAWLERSRAQAFRVRPVRPPADPQAAATARRTASAQLPDPGGRAERQPRPGRWPPGAPSCSARSGSTAGRPAGWARPPPLAGLGEVSAALEQSGQSLVGILARDGQMLAVVVRRGSARLVGSATSKRPPRPPGG